MLVGDKPGRFDVSWGMLPVFGFLRLRLAMEALLLKPIELLKASVKLLPRFLLALFAVAARMYCVVGTFGAWIGLL